MTGRLFVVSGPSGVGKTHLLHAIGNALAAGPPPRIVACLSSAAFIEELVSAVEAGNVDVWRRRYRRADAFLLDDIQQIAGKEQTQDELFNLFNALAESEKQLVFAGDRPPNRLEGVEARLLTRFEGGLVVELTAPDRAMREVMVRRLLEAQEVKADADVVQYLNNGDYRGLVREKIGRNQVDMMDILARNAFLSHPYPVHAGGTVANREAIKSTDLFDPDFAELARQHSTCPSGARGGDLGEFSPGQMVREFNDVCFNEEVGVVHGPVKTQFGYHLIEVTKRED